MYFSHTHRHDSKTKTTSTELDVNIVCRLAWRNTTHCVPRYCKSLILSTCMSNLFALVLAVSNSTSVHLPILAAKISSTENIGLRNIQGLVEPSL